MAVCSGDKQVCVCLLTAVVEIADNRKLKCPLALELPFKAAPMTIFFTSFCSSPRTFELRNNILQTGCCLLGIIL